MSTDSNKDKPIQVEAELVEDEPINRRAYKHINLNGGRPLANRSRAVFSVSWAMMRLLTLPTTEFRRHKCSNMAEVIAKRVIRKAAEGDLSSAKEIMDRVEGRVRQQIDVSSLSEIERARAKFDAAVEAMVLETNCSHEDAIRALIAVNPSYQALLTA